MSNEERETHSDKSAINTFYRERAAALGRLEDTQLSI